jgi:hypothetical protein
MQLAALPRSRAEFNAGSRIAANIAMMAITTSNSIRVKYFFIFHLLIFEVSLFKYTIFDPEKQRI